PLSQVFLRPATTYRASIVGGPGGACSATSGAEMASTFRWVFTTEGACDGAAPTVAMRDPQDGASGRPLNQEVVLDFTGRIEPASLRSNPLDVPGSGFIVLAGGVVSSGDVSGATPVAGTARFENGNRTLVFHADAPLPAQTTIRVRLTNALQSACGDALVT